MKCPNDHENPPAAAFCMTCGATLEAAPAATPPDVAISDPGSPDRLPQRPEPRKANVRTLLIVGAVVAFVIAVALAVAFGGGDEGPEASDTSSSDPAEPKPLLQAAYDNCAGQKGGGTLTAGDEGRTLIIDTRSEYGPIAGLACVFGELDTSQAIIAQMESTTAMMGVQQAEDDGIRYQFSYHPDNGINMVITDLSDD